LFTSGIFLKLQKYFRATFFLGKSYPVVLTKSGLGFILGGFFSQAHSVALAISNVCFSEKDNRSIRSGRSQGMPTMPLLKASRAFYFSRGMISVLSDTHPPPLTPPPPTAVSIKPRYRGVHCSQGDQMSFFKSPKM
jgi:hypothetical protein